MGHMFFYNQLSSPQLEHVPLLSQTLQLLVPIKVPESAALWQFCSQSQRSLPKGLENPKQHLWKAQIKHTWKEGRGERATIPSERTTNQKRKEAHCLPAASNQSMSRVPWQGAATHMEEWAQGRTLHSLTFPCHQDMLVSLSWRSAGDKNTLSRNSQKAPFASQFWTQT